MKSSLKFCLLAFLLASTTFSFAQVDTTWLKFTRNNGAISVDVTLKDPQGRYYFLQEGTTFSFRESAPGIKTNTYRPMAGYTTTDYTQGQLRRFDPLINAETFEQNYRLLFPLAYNPNYAEGYPLLVMIHGFGERANCWGTNCYHANTAYNANINNLNTGTIISVANGSNPTAAIFTTSAPHGFADNSMVVITTGIGGYNGTRRLRTVTGQPNQFRLSPSADPSNNTSWITFSNTTTGTIIRLVAPTDINHQLLNNDHNLTHGGSPELTARNLANGRLPNDPTMPSRAFPGFVFHPQNMNGWGGAIKDADNAVRTIRLLMKKYNIDPNRVYIHGLSDGGAGAYNLTRSAPWLFAATLPMSAVNDAGIQGNELYSDVNSIPFWVFQGGIDGNPTPAQTLGRVNGMKNNGLNVRYYIYPTLGHGTWNTAYAEPDFFTWILEKNKANPQLLYGRKEVCGTSGAGATMVLGQGFFAYQWEKDGELIPGATTYTYTATFPGTYRVRFSRKQNPGPSDWNRWSDPIVIVDKTPAKPVILKNNTIVFPNTANDPAGYSTTNTTNAVTFISNEKAEKYLWYKDNVKLALNDTISRITRSLSSGLGTYYLKTATIDNCESPPSDPVYFAWSTPNPNPPSVGIFPPTNFAGTANSSSAVFLSWTDNSLNETGFEVWRRKSGETIFKFIVVTKEDAVSYLDTGLEGGTTYEYKLRAVNVTGRSNHAPNNTATINLTVSTPGDNIPPTAPQNLQVVINDATSITLKWDASTDNVGINQYVVYYGLNAIATGNTKTTYKITGLPTNQYYPITIKAQDKALNLSAPSNQVMGTTHFTGLYYEHTTDAQTSIPAWNWNIAEYSGRMPNFSILPPYRTQQDFFNFKYDGYFYVPITRRYQFQTISNDGSMVFIDGFDPNNLALNRVVNNVNNSSTQVNQVTTTAASSTNPYIELTAGFHRIVVLYFQYTEGKELTVNYRRRNAANNGFDINYAAIPDNLLTTNPNFTLPTPPTAPSGLNAIANGMTSINLTWTHALPATVEFEVYRASSLAGTYSLINRVTSTSFVDQNLLPGTIYYYKVNAVNANGSSAFGNIANATTDTDTTTPTVPSFLSLISKTFSNVAFNWTASSDNVGVTGYEILIDGNAVGTTPYPNYMVTNLAPGTSYNLTVKALDAAGNKSVASTALAVTTNSGVMYYSKNTGTLNTNTTWGTNADGNGASPNFTYNGQIYIVANRVSTGLGGSLTIGGSISKIIVPAGTTLDVDNPIVAKVEVQGDGVINLNNASAPEFVSVSNTSTINFNTYSTVPVGTFGNVSFTGSGNKNFQTGETIIMGNLTAAPGVALKGSPSNGSHVTVYGDMTFNGAPGVVATDNALDLLFAKTGTQTVTLGGALDLYKVSTSSATNVNFVNSGSTITLNVGSTNGGGLTLANGSTLNLGNNHLVMKFAGTINSGGETGKLAMNGGNLTLTSTAAQNSNLYFDTSLKTAGMVTATFSGGGKLMIQSPLVITDGLKVKAGEFSAAGNVTLVSNATKTAYLQELEGNGSVTGNVNVQRWISIARKYRYMSSVVSTMKVADWQPYMPITGPFTGSSANSSNSSMFYYVENNGGYKPYPAAGSDNQVTFGKGVGYSIFNYNGNAPVTLVMRGNPYQGNVPYTLSPGTGGNDGWNLIGNPYASAIQWNNLTTDWTKSGVSPIVHVPDNTSGTLVYRTYDASTGLGPLTGGIISPGQAFWVQTINASPALTITEKAKRTNTSTFYREGDSPANSFTVILSNGSTQDDTYVILGDSYSDAYEPEADGMKLKNGVVNLSSRSTDQVKLVFNKLSDSFCEKTVALSIEDVPVGNYTLSFANVSNLVGVGEVTLTDHFTNTTVSANDSDQYMFAITSDAASLGAGRFTLTLNRPALEKNAIASVQNLCGGSMATIQLANTQAGVFYYATKPDETTALTAEGVGNGGSISLEVPVSALQPGSNNLVIRTGFKGCSNELLSTTPMSFTYTVTPNVTVAEPYFSICEGTPLTLSAETSSGNTFHWYKNGELITGQTGATLYTDLIKKSTVYEVAAVTANGCEGYKTLIQVEAENVPFPFIDFDGDAITITNGAPEGLFVQWYKDQEPLEVYTPYLQPKEDGQYSVLVSHNGCSKISDAFTYAVTAVEPVAGNNTFAAYVYPNPATSENLYIKIETPANQDAEITMMDLSGRKTFSTRVNSARVNGVHKINFPQDTTPGLYIVTIQQGDLVLHRKVVVTFR